MTCSLCHNAASRDMLALYPKPLCLPCAGAISQAYQTCPTRPARRHEIAALFAKYQIACISTDQWTLWLAECCNDEQIHAMIHELSKTGKRLSVAFVAGALRHRMSSHGEPKKMPTEAEQPAEPATPDWQKQGFASEQQYEQCDWAYTQSGRKQKWAQFKSEWLDGRKA